MLAPALCILLSSFLLFLVQPIVAKQVLPWFGGAAGVWTMCLVFFQVTLLLGYLYAHWITRLARSFRQVQVHLTLIFVSFLVLPIIPSDRWKPGPETNPSLQILGLLATTIGLPYFLLSSTAPLLQKWLSVTTPEGPARRSIYRLFALSNLGSLAGLLAYPFIIEPFSTLRTQSWVWSAAYVLYGLLLALYAWPRRDALVVATHTAQAAPDGGIARPSLALYGYWLGCAALGSVLLLAVTNHTTENVASIPLVWIVPLSIYLFSFVVCFEGKNGRGWYSRRGWAAPISIGLGAMACALYAGHALLSIYLAYPIFWVGLFLGCVLCHGELSRSKPDTRYLTQFYLTVACGGALGGILVAVVAPLVFDNYWETPLAFVLAALLAMYVSVLEDGHQSAQRWLGMVAIGFLGSFIILTLLGALPGDLNEYTLEWAKIIEGDAKWGCAVLLIVVAFFLQSRRLRGAVALGTLICACASGWNYYHYLSLDTELAVRNFYGALRVKVNVIGSDHLRSLLHGLITHGTEFGHPPQSEMPTSYYSHTSGVGRTLLAFQDMQTTKRVGSVGLGVGTLAAYGSPGDAFRMYELNPAVLSIAMTRFSYLACSAAQVETVLGDARLSLERELAQGEFEDPARRFDVLSVDAFSGDSIPVHLLTREAFSVYTRAIKDDGVIAYHLSNRYLDLSPVVGNIARQAGYQALLVLDAHPEGDAISPSLWVLVTKNAAFLARPAIASVGAGIPDAPKIGVWTDQLNNLFQVLK